MPGTRADLEAVVRLELTTCCLRNSRSSSWSYTAVAKWTGREADAPLLTPRSRQSPFCRMSHAPITCETKVGAQGRTQTFNLWFVGPALHQLSYSGMNLVVGVGIEPTFRVFQTRANPSQLSDLWGSWQDSNPQLRRSKRRTLPVELQEQHRDWSAR